MIIDDYLLNIYIYIYGFSMGFPWVFYGLSMGFHGFSMGFYGVYVGIHGFSMLICWRVMNLVD